MSTQTLERISALDYLKQEREAEFKSEYIHHEVHPMAGASLFHLIISGNIFFILKLLLRGSKHLIFQSDMRVSGNGNYLYPDVVVVEGDCIFSDARNDILINPSLIIEVLSPSTVDYDRGAKFEAYRTIPSLREYILVAQDRPHIELFRLNDAGRWELFEVNGLDSQIELASVPCTLKLAEVYEKIDFQEASR